MVRISEFKPRNMSGDSRSSHEIAQNFLLKVIVPFEGWATFGLTESLQFRAYSVNE